MSELRASEDKGFILQEGESVLSPDPLQPHENPLLQRFRGHRQRTWDVPEALECLRLIREGHDVTEAATLSGIPVSVALGQGDQGPAGTLLRAAILSVYAHEGADWYSRQNRRVVTGELPPQATGAIRTGLQEHGRLRDREAPAAAQTIAIQVRIVPGARDQPPAIEVQARSTPPL